MKRALVACLALLAAAVAIKLLLFDFPRVAGNDMAPAVQRGDWLLVYTAARPPSRGQLILFKHTKRARLLIRRVIALPGETIAVRNEVPIVAGRALPRRKQGIVRLEGEARQVIEERLGHHAYRVLKDPNRRSVDQPELSLRDEYFVMADDRNHGTGSRSFGPVPAGNIVGVVTHRLTAGPGDIDGQPPRPGFTRLSH